MKKTIQTLVEEAELRGARWGAEIAAQFMLESIDMSDTSSQEKYQKARLATDNKHWIEQVNEVNLEVATIAVKMGREGKW